MTTLLVQPVAAVSNRRLERIDFFFFAAHCRRVQSKRTRCVSAVYVRIYADAAFIVRAGVQ